MNSLKPSGNFRLPKTKTCETHCFFLQKKKKIRLTLAVASQKNKQRSSISEINSANGSIS
jgi:hypothetical protein